jgi:hypothetical protein
MDLLNETLILAEDNGGWATVDTWEGFDDGTFTRDTTGPFWSFLDDMETSFNAASTNTYQWQIVTSDPFGRDDYRLKLVRTAGSLPFRLSSSDTIMTRLGATNPTDVLTDSSGTITFPNHYDGCWILPNTYNYLDERERPRQDAKVVVTNNDTVHVARKNTRRDRYFQWEKVDADLVFKDAVDYSWRRTNVSANEVNASFEHFWEECLSQGRRFAVYHDIPPASVSLDDSAYGYYMMVLQDPEMINSVWAMLEDRLEEFGSEVYDIMFTARELSIVHP